MSEKYSIIHNSEFIRFAVGEIKKLALTRSPHYEQPADSFIEKAVLKILVQYEKLSDETNILQQKASACDRVISIANEEVELKAIDEQMVK